MSYLPVSPLPVSDAELKKLIQETFACNPYLTPTIAEVALAVRLIWANPWELEWTRYLISTGRADETSPALTLRLHYGVTWSGYAVKIAMQVLDRITKS
jgi:hypothetical protein